MSGRDSAALLAYRVFLYVAAPVVAMRWLARALRDRRYFDKCQQRLGFIGAQPQWRGGIWIHAVSVGEVNAAAPLIEHLLARHPNKPVTVTTMTPTGAERVTATFGKRVRHCYLPYDYPGAARRFLKRASPRLALVMETEIWPNLIAGCSRLGVPVFYLNARLSRRSLRGYWRYQSLLAPALRAINQFAAQNRADARRLMQLGAPAAAVSITGNLKFDITPGAEADKTAQAIRRHFGARPVWLAGSTHEGEEAQILDAFARVAKHIEALLLVIVPRHPQRFRRVFRLCSRNFRAELRSQTRGESDGVGADTAVYVADTMGELPALIAAADVAFIGGSLVPVGGHNVLEAAAAGVPVVFGPHMFNFKDIADQLAQHAAGIQVFDADELAEVAQRLLGDANLRRQYAERGRALVKKNRGALAKVCALVDAELARQAAR